ncbi:MAG: enoyl-CoA hydratase/isomerase family protein [Rhodospirillaceae bacterium]
MSSISKTYPKARNIDVETHENIALVALNRPDVRNAIDDSMRSDLIEIMDWAERAETIQALIITGRGKAFCAGGDIAAMQERLKAPGGKVAINGWKRQRRTHKAISMLHELSIPTIAAVNGPAAGLGADLALACDFVIASKEAFFVFSYLMRGLIPDGGGMYFLPRRVGLARAKELFFSARRVSAEEALQMNMVEEISEPELLIKNALEMANNMTKGSPDALALTKTILDQTFERSMEEVFALGCQAQAICYTTDAHQESVANFLNKQKSSHE